MNIYLYKVYNREKIKNNENINSNIFKILKSNILYISYEFITLFFIFLSV